MRTKEAGSIRPWWGSQGRLPGGGGSWEREGRDGAKGHFSWDRIQKQAPLEEGRGGGGAGCDGPGLVAGRGSMFLPREPHSAVSARQNHQMEQGLGPFPGSLLSGQGGGVCGRVQKRTHVHAHTHTYVHACAACPLNDMVCIVRGTRVQRMGNEGSQRSFLEAVALERLSGFRQEGNWVPRKWGCVHAPGDVAPFVRGRRTRAESSDCKIEMTYE